MDSNSSQWISSLHVRSLHHFIVLIPLRSFCRLRHNCLMTLNVHNRFVSTVLLVYSSYILHVTAKSECVFQLENRSIVVSFLAFPLKQFLCHDINFFRLRVGVRVERCVWMSREIMFQGTCLPWYHSWLQLVLDWSLVDLFEIKKSAGFIHFLSIVLNCWVRVYFFVLDVTLKMLVWLRIHAECCLSSIHLSLVFLFSNYELVFYNWSWDITFFSALLIFWNVCKFSIVFA